MNSTSSYFSSFSSFERNFGNPIIDVAESYGFEIPMLVSVVPKVIDESTHPEDTWIGFILGDSSQKLVYKKAMLSSEGPKIDDTKHMSIISRDCQAGSACGAHYTCINHLRYPTHQRFVAYSNAFQKLPDPNKRPSTSSLSFTFIALGPAICEVESFGIVRVILDNPRESKMVGIDSRGNIGRSKRGSEKDAYDE